MRKFVFTLLLLLLPVAEAMSVIELEKAKQDFEKHGAFHGMGKACGLGMNELKIPLMELYLLKGADQMQLSVLGMHFEIASNQAQSEYAGYRCKKDDFTFLKNNYIYLKNEIYLNKKDIVESRYGSLKKPINPKINSGNRIPLTPEDEY